ncbi:MAG: tripartite tricarboxylate transporter TctB family protein [Burkholderiales bacterium]|jgi:putative tricarboxylic transport membrane protein|nr:tripartite tricarboxylate transporter TctB family protein [Burkholderiales bacterium]
MSEPESSQTPSRLSTTLVESLMALFFVLVGVVVAVDSHRIGAGWADDGPQAGYFPFYIGLMLALAGVVTLAQAWRGASAEAFATREQISRILQVFVPTCVYVAGIYLIGIYFASALFIGYFMRRHGTAGWPMVAAVSIGVPLSLFMLFERWFLVSLPKGPIERLLGF